MRILVSNDDGIRAPGIRALVAAARNFGTVKIVAPDRERSACGHAMTIREPLRVAAFEWEGCEAYEVNGVPTDCINLGLAMGWPDGCDLVLSGINNGPNLGFDITYSGTVAAAMEATINGVFAISVSMAQFVSGSPLHYETGQAWLEENLGMLIDAPRKDLTLLNVNVPNIHDATQIRGHRVAPMGRRVYIDRMEMRQDPWGKDYYWQGGAVVMTTGQPNTDVQAVNDGFVSVTPVTVDWTDHAHLEALERSFNAYADRV
ncbi:MAG: 5'/3'-nucleotidase SurE [Fimbriimonas sp.]